MGKKVILYTIKNALHQNLDSNKIKLLKENINKSGKILFIGESDATPGITQGILFVNKLEKVKEKMKVAISTDREFVSGHFGRCPHFTFVDIDNGKVVQKEVINNPGHHPGFLPQFLKERGVNVIIAGGMGTRAQELFDDAKISTIIGIEGKVQDTIDKLIAGTLKGGESICSPGTGKGYGIDKDECDHGNHQ